MEISGPAQRVMEAALSVRSARAELLAANVANADTPSYLARDINFNDAIDRVLDGGIESAGETAASSENMSANGNDVDLNSQLARSYENALGYVATLKLYGDSIGRIKIATSA
jgi:flagellar basal-body rod protein FlgB